VRHAWPSLWAYRIDAGGNAKNMIEPTRHFPRAAYTAMPWRNGAGITHEIAREPAHAESFAWRLSLASLQASGPFSIYTGYERCVALVDGRGFRLHIAGAGTKLLAARGEHALFAGAAEVRCELLDGPCTDLSLMVREPGTIDSVTRLAISAEQSVQVPAGKQQVLFMLRGAIVCRPLGPLIPDAPNEDVFKLNFNDTLLMQGSAHSWSIERRTSEAAELLLIAFAIS
jgi:environmental stress-induced protein Ves